MGGASERGDETLLICCRLKPEANEEISIKTAQRRQHHYREGEIFGLANTDCAGYRLHTEAEGFPIKDGLRPLNAERRDPLVF